MFAKRIEIRSPGLDADRHAAVSCRIGRTDRSSLTTRTNAGVVLVIRHRGFPYARPLLPAERAVPESEANASRADDPERLLGADTEASVTGGSG